MGRLVVWLLLGLVAWWLLRPRRRAPPAPARERERAVRAPEAMVDCARCGVHLPASEALRDAGGRAYCSAAHRVAGPRDAR